MNSTVLWYVARGSGVVAYLLLTLSVILGIALSRRWHSPSWPRFVVHEMHRWATLVFYSFLSIHILTVAIDPYVHFSLADVLVPFASHYRTFWLGLGIIGGELALAIGASVWVREYIGYRTWHVLHALSYPVFFVSLAHGLGTGTDTGTRWMTAVYVASAIAVLSATIWRLLPWSRLSFAASRVTSR